MTTTAKPERDHTQQHEGAVSVLPLAIRQRLWDQLWTRLLAPPIDPADKVPASQDRNARDGDLR